MPVYVNDLVTEVTMEDDADAASPDHVADGASKPEAEDDLRYAYERLMRDLSRTRSEGFSD
jgi:hypothetical protein